MKKVKVLKNQTMFDIAIQEYGSVDGDMLLAKANNMSVTDDLEVGMELIVEGDVIDSEIVDYYKKNSILPATATSKLPCLFKGIGYMQIESTFKVGASCSDDGLNWMMIAQTFKVN